VLDDMLVSNLSLNDRLYFAAHAGDASTHTDASAAVTAMRNTSRRDGVGVHAPPSVLALALADDDAHWRLDADDGRRAR
jgi:hypothetical protein